MIGEESIRRIAGSVFRKISNRMFSRIAEEGAEEAIEVKNTESEKEKERRLSKEFNAFMRDPIGKLKNDCGFDNDTLSGLYAICLNNQLDFDEELQNNSDYDFVELYAFDNSFFSRFKIKFMEAFEKSGIKPPEEEDKNSEKIRKFLKNLNKIIIHFCEHKLSDESKKEIKKIEQIVKNYIFGDGPYSREAFVNFLAKPEKVKEIKTELHKNPSIRNFIEKNIFDEIIEKFNMDYAVSDNTMYRAESYFIDWVLNEMRGPQMGKINKDVSEKAEEVKNEAKNIPLKNVEEDPIEKEKNKKRHMEYEEREKKALSLDTAQNDPDRNYKSPVDIQTNGREKITDLLSDEEPFQRINFVDIKKEKDLFDALSYIKISPKSFRERFKDSARLEAFIDAIKTKWSREKFKKEYSENETFRNNIKNLKSAYLYFD